MKYIAKEIAIQNLNQFFSQTQDDVVSVRDACLAWGRTLENEEKDRSWFSNKLTQLKYHNLVKPKYVFRNNRRVLDAIQLTLEGKKLLDRVETDAGTPPVNPGTPPPDMFPVQNGTALPERVTLEEVMKILARFKKENPDYEINFDVKLKGM